MSDKKADADKGKSADSKASTDGGKSGVLNPFESAFKAFNKGGNITLDNAKKWLKQSKIINEKVSESDVEKVFKKVANTKDSLSAKEFQEFIQALATEKKLEAKDLLDKLAKAGMSVVGNVSDTVGKIGK